MNKEMSEIPALEFNGINASMVLLVEQRSGKFVETGCRGQMVGLRLSPWTFNVNVPY